MGYLIVFIMLFFSASPFAEAASLPTGSEKFWNLPQELNDQNLKIDFAVDSTWHLVEGATSSISGKAWLDNPQDFRSVRAEISLPVATFDTQNSRRDRRMREVMQAEQFPNVNFRLEQVLEVCDPKTVKEGHVCNFRVRGVLRIRDVEKTIDWPSKISYQPALAAFKLEGKSEIDWQDFGIEDPSIFIAKVYPQAQISFVLNLPAEQS